MNRFGRVKLFSSLLTVALLLVTSACSSSVDSTERDEAVKAQSDPSTEYAKALKSVMVDLEDHWKQSYSMSRQSLYSALNTIQVEVDKDFSVVTITAELDFKGKDASDLRDGGWVGYVTEPELDTKLFCAGKNDTDLDTFEALITDTMEEMLGIYSVSDLSSLGLPSKGLIIRMNWNHLTYSVDKYGDETKKRDFIGVDQFGISTENLKKIKDPALANYRELSDFAPLKFAKQSWFNGYCAYAQKSIN
jgi:hypothetical protein